MSGLASRDKELGPAFNISSVAFAIIGKLLFASLILYTFNGFQCGSKFHFFESGDTPGYLMPAENLINHGLWALDATDPRTSSFRPPAYGLVYLLFRGFASKGAAEWLLITLQLLLSALAGIFFARTVLVISGSPRLSTAALLFCVFNPQLAIYDLRLLTESLTLSACLVANYLFARDGFGRPKTTAVLGLLLCFIVFMRPFLGLLLPVWSLLALWEHGRAWKDSVKTLSLLGAPLALSMAAWTTWSYPRVGRLIFFQSNFPSGYTEFDPYVRFARATSEDPIHWNPDSAAGWFQGKPASEQHRFPEILFKNVSYDKNSLDRARAMIISSGLKRGSTGYIEAEAALNRYGEQFQLKHPLYSRVIGPFKLLPRFFRFMHTDGIHNTNFYAKHRLFQRVLAVEGSGANMLLALALVAGFIVKLSASQRFAYIAAVSLFALNTFMIIGVLRMPEGRYALIPMWLLFPWGLAVAAQFAKKS